MKQLILQLIDGLTISESVVILRKNKEAVMWLIANTPPDCLSYAERLYILRNNEPTVCKYGNRKKYSLKTKTLAFCGRGCKCLKEIQQLSRKHEYAADDWAELMKNRQIKTEHTNMCRYGVNNPVQSSAIKAKIKQTKLDRYGDEYYNNQEQAITTTNERYGVDHYNNRKQAITTTNERYGVDNWMQSESASDLISPFSDSDVQRKARETKLALYGNEYYNNQDQLKNTVNKKYGVDCVFASDDIKTKIRNTNYEKYGVYNAASSCNVKEKIKNTRYLAEKQLGYRYGQKHFTSYAKEVLNSDIKFTELFKQNSINMMASILKVCPETIRRHCNKYKIHYSNSTLEDEMKIFLDDIKVRHISNIRKIIAPFELDFYMPDYNLAIEMNGIYWHTDKFKADKNYHYNKWKMCKDLGITLLSINEDTWHLSQDKVKNLIKTKLNMKKRGVGARQCNIVSITAKEARPLLEQYHLQNFVGGKHYGAYFGNELVGVMTFGWTRGSKKSRRFELKRWVTDYAGHPGLASKTFKFAQNELKFDSIVSFSDNRFFDGNMYHMLGFDFVKTTYPGYEYFYNGRMVHKSHFIKSRIKKLFPDADLSKTENQLITELDIPKLWDCGKKEWVWTK